LDHVEENENKNEEKGQQDADEEDVGIHVDTLLFLHRTVMNVFVMIGTVRTLSSDSSNLYQNLSSKKMLMSQTK
jgi:hypothetical protein